ncbi:MAG: AAA family ATPase [Candidatus Hydrothermales bacterium]
MKTLKIKDLSFIEFIKIPRRNLNKLMPLEGFIGQKEALRSMEFGLRISSKTHHIFVSGKPGSGRTSMVLEYVSKIAEKLPPPPDVIYVYSHENPFSPKAIFLEAGQGKKFKKDMEDTIRESLEEVKAITKIKEFNEAKEKILENFIAQRERLLNNVRRKATELGIFIKQKENGFDFLPLTRGKILTPEEYFDLSKNEKEEFDKKINEIRKELNKVLNEIEKLNSNFKIKIRDLLSNFGAKTLSTIFPPLIGKYLNNKEIIKFVLNSVQDILENIDYITSKPDEAYLYFKEKYKIHLFIDNSNLKGAPIILETHPTLSRLIGRIERTLENPTLDFSGIIPGAFHKANGGFLIIPAEEILKIEPAYTFLKWTLKSGKILIENVSEEENIHTTKTIKPESIPFNGKVILIGSPSTFFSLKENDPDFNELFKVHVEFKSSMDINEENINDYMRFIKTFCDKEKLLYPDRKALGKIIWYSSRLAGDQEKLSTNFGAICDLLREADFIAKKENTREIKNHHIIEILKNRFKESEIEQTYYEWIKKGTISINFEGKKIGTVNGLTVLTYGEISFGRPVKITATCFAGKEGVIDIEREAELSGPIHTKGTQILCGYLGYKYGQKIPIYMTARIVFEQTYVGVEGDSAQAAELVAVISSLSEIPVYQNCAITGSINQFGEIQAVGGINEKIEGIAKTLKYIDYKGTFKVLFPESNLKNLCLQDEVFDLTKKRVLKLITIKNIDEAIRVAFNKKPEIVHQKVISKLKRYYKIFKTD